MKRDCPICSTREKEQLYYQSFHNKVISLMEGYDVVVCKKCGFIYADNIPSQNEFNKYYEVMSKYEFNHKEGVVSNEYIDHFNKMVDFFAPYMGKKTARILDIGCSTGGLLSALKSRGYFNLLGIDPSPSCARTTKELYDIEAKVNNISNFRSEGKFDCIILSAVLEHLVNFKDALEKIRSLLEDGGMLFIEIPDAERFDAHIFTPFQQFSIEHINYFSLYSAKNLLAKFSFGIIDMRKDENRINQSVDPDIFILAKKSDKVNFEITKDEACEPRIRNYIAQSLQIDVKIKKIIKEKLLGKGKIIVWGVGTHTQRLIGSGLDLSKILFFVDSNAKYKGKKINGIEIKSPGDIKDNAPILISTYSYQEEVARQIKETLKLKNEVIKIY